MNISIVYNVNDDLTIVAKGESKVAIYREGALVVVVSDKIYEKFPFVPFSRLYKDEHDAKVGWLKMIGLLSNESNESCYFDNPDFTTHIINGNPDKIKESRIRDISLECWSILDRIFNQ